MTPEGVCSSFGGHCSGRTSPGTAEDLIAVRPIISPWPGFQTVHAQVAVEDDQPVAGAGDDRFEERIALAEDSLGGRLKAGQLIGGGAPGCAVPCSFGRHGDRWLRPFELRRPAYVTLCPSSCSWASVLAALCPMQDPRPLAATECGPGTARQRV